LQYENHENYQSQEVHHPQQREYQSNAHPQDHHVSNKPKSHERAKESNVHQKNDPLYPVQNPHDVKRPSHKANTEYSADHSYPQQQFTSYQNEQKPKKTQPRSIRSANRRPSEK
jgi:hypothetical protein